MTRAERGMETRTDPAAMLSVWWGEVNFVTVTITIYKGNNAM